MKIYAQKSLRRRGVELYLGETRGNRDYAILPVALQERTVEPGEMHEPALTIPMEAAQDLMQQLWDQGFRPNNGAGSSAEADALKNHIKFAEQVATRLLSPPALFNPRIDVLRADEQCEIRHT